jgi:hypothetical protein
MLLPREESNFQASHKMHMTHGPAWATPVGCTGLKGWSDRFDGMGAAA